MAGNLAIVPGLDEDAGIEIVEPPSLSFGKTVSRHRKKKKAATKLMGLGGVGVQGAQMGTGISTVGAVAGTAGTVGTGGAALIIGGAVLTVAGSGLAARSAYKTNKHINGLKDIYSKRKSYKCSCGPGNIEHAYIGGNVLPYIIQQKRSKLHRKSASVVPGVAALEKIRAGANNLLKRAAGTLGKERTFAAEWLAVHLLKEDCELAEAIVSELFSPEEMLWLKEQDSDVVAPLLSEKMKSV